MTSSPNGSGAESSGIISAVKDGIINIPVEFADEADEVLAVNGPTVFFDEIHDCSLLGHGRIPFFLIGGYIKI